MNRMQACVLCELDYNLNVNRKIIDFVKDLDISMIQIHVKNSMHTENIVFLGTLTLITWVCWFWFSGSHFLEINFCLWKIDNNWVRNGHIVILFSRFSRALQVAKWNTNKNATLNILEVRWKQCIVPAGSQLIIKLAFSLKTPAEKNYQTEWKIVQFTWKNFFKSSHFIVNEFYL